MRYLHNHSVKNDKKNESENKEPRPSDFGVIEIDRLTHKEFMAEIQEGIDSGEGREASEVFDEILSKSGDH